MAHSVLRPPTAFTLDGRRSRTKQPRQNASGHLAFIRELPSLVPGPGPVEAAHIRYGAPIYGKPKVGMAEKPDDKWVVPLCAAEHRRQHDMNERDYWASVEIDPVLVAALLWAHTGNHDAAVLIIRNATMIGRDS